VDNFNGTVTDYTYDNANRLTDLVNKKANQTIISQYHFILDGNGKRQNVTQSEPLLPVINEDTSNYTYNPERNRLETAGASGFDYDNEGQLATKDVHLFTFDYAHRLKTVSGANNYQYSYDGSGKRLKAVRDSVETRYIYDAAGNLLAEANSSNVIMKYYIHGAGLMAMVKDTNEVYAYHYDAVGNTIAMTDETEGIVNSYAYTPFGILANENESVIQPFKFVGKYGVMTEPNGFYYMRARYYDTEIGRFISEDPIGFDGGDVNLYAYVGNNPVLLIDPDGLWGEETHGTYAEEDHGWTSPFNPLSTWRHFRPLEDVQPELDKAIASGDRDKFNSLMHQGQDSFSHYDAGYRWWKGGHIRAGHEPDSTERNPEAYKKMLEWTRRQEATWDAARNPKNLSGYGSQK
jgi:RHS repeat-associated protein